MLSVIFGAGDVGRRIISQLLNGGMTSDEIHAYVNTVESAERCARLKVVAQTLNLDDIGRDLSLCHNSNLYYTVPPQGFGVTDMRSAALLEFWQLTGVTPRKVVLISTTGVYGDCDGEWVNENSPTAPQTDRGKRRLDSERAWLDWGHQNGVPVVVLRVPGIYAYSRLPRQRLLKRTPVVRADECGYTNRIHADDLAQISVRAMESGGGGEIFNVTDGVPGKISEYLQTAAHVIGMSPLPEISMQDAQTHLSAGMLSYLSESRKISNEKMLAQLDIKLRYPDFKVGIKE